MKTLKVIETVSEQAVADATTICHPNINARTGFSLQIEWRGRWFMARYIYGAYSPVCMALNRAIALIDGAVAYKVGGSSEVPSPVLLYPQGEVAA